MPDQMNRPPRSLKRQDEWLLIRSQIGPGDLMDRQECEARLGVSPRHFRHMWGERGKLPPPITLGDHNKQLWLRAEMEPYIEHYVQHRKVRKHLRAWKQKYDKQEGNL